MTARKDKVPGEVATMTITRCRGRLQHQAERKKNKFTPKRRQNFLDALALCCNITMAAAHVGIVPGTAHRWRARDPLFKAQWREALETGLERLEMLVVEHGGAGLPLEPADPDRAADEGASPAFDFDKAIRALQLYAKTRVRPDHRSDAQIKPATAAETDAAILDLLRRMRPRLGAASLPALPAPDDAAELS